MLSFRAVKYRNDFFNIPASNLRNASNVIRVFLFKSNHFIIRIVPYLTAQLLKSHFHNYLFSVVSHLSLLQYSLRCIFF